MKEYTFEMKRTEVGQVTVAAKDYWQAIEKAYEYTSRIIHVNNRPWYGTRTIEHRKMEEEV